MKKPKSPALRQVPVRPKLGLEISETLRQALLSGQYERGQHLVLEDLAGQLGVSIMPVREALIGLANEGLVQALPRRGFRASPMSPADIDDIFELHAHIAGILAERAAGVITAEDVASLRAIQAQIEELSRRRMSKAVPGEMHALNNSFHRLINRLPEGDRLRWFMKSTASFVRRDSYEALPGWIEATLTDHPAIVAALEAGDGKRARSLVEDHFRKGVELRAPVQAKAATEAA